jgi:serine phosphatase RsbU (regulator of sigma subunit)
VNATPGALPDREVLGELVRELDTAAPYELVEVCEGWLRRRVGARWSTVLLADYSQTVLEPVPGRGSGSAAGRRHAVRDGAAGVCYREQRVVRESEQQDVQGCELVLCVPVTIRSECLGVLMVGLGRDTADGIADVLVDVATVLAHVLAGARRYTDRFEALRRRKDLGLAAEIQWELLPVLAYELPVFSIAGALEPTYEIGGDTFDYAVSASRLTISITDAVGHGLRAALLGSLAVTAMRNIRRGGGDILAQAGAANEHLAEQFPDSSFVTGQLLEIDVASGSALIINAGHPLPLLRRDGVVVEVPLAPDLPLGLKSDTVYRPARYDLQHGDRLLLITDGITEAHLPGKAAFGTERVAQLLSTQAHHSPAEFVRQLTAAVLTFRDGELADDATAVCLDWH